MSPHLPRSTLFPYTTLFRSNVGQPAQRRIVGREIGRRRLEQLLEAVDDEIGLLEAVDAVLRAHDPHQVEADPRSEEHTSELQSHSDLVCRLLLEKKNRHKR